MPEPKRPLKVFLCHASTDKPKVRELYRYLKRRGIRPWFDEVDLIGGQDWQVEIPKALTNSDAIIICLTKNSVDKEGYIQKEIKFALDKALEMPEGRIFLIPVKFEECEVPFSLSRYQWVDLTIEAGYSKMMKALKFRASQLERSTVEISKKTIEEEKLVLEKAEREATEKAAREKQEQEAVEKARLKAEEQTRQKAAKEKVGWEEAERIAREKAEKEAAEKARLEAEELARQMVAKEKAEHEFTKKSTRRIVEKEVVKKTQLEVEELARQKVAKEKNTRRNGNLETREISFHDKRFLKVFLCYAHADLAAVRELYNRLIRDGADTWLDEEKLISGQDRDIEIRKAIYETDVVVVCLSKCFNQDVAQQEEVRLALDIVMEKPKGEVLVILARLEECDTLESLKKWQQVDLFATEGYKRLMLAFYAKADSNGAVLDFEFDPSSLTPADSKFLEKVIAQIMKIPVVGSFSILLAMNSLLKKIFLNHKKNEK